MLEWAGRRRGRFLVDDPGLAVAFGGVVGLLALFVVFPVLRVVGYPSVSDYGAVFAHPRWMQALRNSLGMMALSTATATLVGAVFAFATARSVPGSRFFRTVLLLPLFAPPFMVAFSYILMFGRNGLITRGLLGWDVDIFGWPGLWLTQTIAFFPYAALIIGGVLEALDPSLEYAARDLGAREWDVYRTVLVPLARPGVAAAALLVAISVLADFGNAVLIAGDFPLLATEAWFLIEGWGDLRGAAIAVSLLLGPTVGLFWLERRWVRPRVYAVVTGRGSWIPRPPVPRPLGWAVGVFCGLVSVLVLLVYVGVGVGSVVHVWGYDWRPTLAHWRLVVEWSGPLLHSLKVAAVSAVLTTALAVTVAFLTGYYRVYGSRLLDFAAVLPAALPGVFVGIGFLLAFGRPPLELTGTMWALVLALTFWHLPTAYQAVRASLAQVEPSLGEAAADLGASALRTLTDIYVPLLRSAVLASLTTSFIRAATNLSIAVFLVTPEHMVATLAILMAVHNGNWGLAAALTVALLAVTLTVLALGRKLLGSGLRPWPVGEATAGTGLLGAR